MLRAASCVTAHAGRSTQDAGTHAHPRHRRHRVHRTVPRAAAALERLSRVFGWVDAEYDKVAVERAVRGDAELPATVLRLPMIYGPGDRLHRFFPLIKRMDDGRPAILLAERVAAWRGPRGYV